MAALTYEQAQNVLQAALRKADEIGVPSSVAVVDERRELVAFARQTVAGATQAPGNARGVAPGILYLASNASSYVTGQELVTDGGLFLRRVLVSNLCRF